MGSDQGKSEAKAMTGAQIVEQTIERTLAPYRGRVPDHMIEALREILEDTLTTDPYAVGIVRHLEARAAPVATEEVARDGVQTNGDRGAEGA